MVEHMTDGFFLNLDAFSLGPGQRARLQRKYNSYRVPAGPTASRGGRRPPADESD